MCICIRLRTYVYTYMYNVNIIGRHRHRSQCRRYPTYDIDICYSDIGDKYVWLKNVIRISDIWHRHLLFRYRRHICWTEKRHSDIGSVPISTSELIPISDIEEKNFSSCRFEFMTLGKVSERYNTELLWLFVYNWCQIFDLKLYSDIDIISDSTLSVRYRKFQY